MGLRSFLALLQERAQKQPESSTNGAEQQRKQQQQDEFIAEINKHSSEHPLAESQSGS